jgi:hypothetical protein
VQIFKSLPAQKLATDFMARRWLALNQRNLLALAGQCDSSGAACHASAEDEDFVMQRNLIQTWRSNWKLLVFPNLLLRL